MKRLFIAGKEVGPVTRMLLLIAFLLSGSTMLVVFLVFLGSKFPDKNTEKFCGSGCTLITDTLASGNLADTYTLYDAVRNHDENGVHSLMLQGRAFLIPGGTRVHAVADDDIAIVWVEEGVLIGKQLYIPRRALQR